MASVLGIDAAWTAKKPSGVALIRTNPGDGRWEYVAVAPGYDAFIRAALGDDVQWQRPKAGSPEPKRLLEAANQLLGSERVTVVSVNLPMSTAPMTGRREADDLVSREFSASACGSYSPDANWPGQISEMLLKELSDLGYKLAVDRSNATDPVNSVIEVYHHPALLRLLNRDFRVPYKVGQSLTYWRGLSRHHRADRLVTEFLNICAGLAREISGIPNFLPECPYDGTLTSLKPYENALDALVCAWVGSRYLEGSARPYGDDKAAILGAYLVPIIPSENRRISTLSQFQPPNPTPATVSRPPPAPASRTPPTAGGSTAAGTG